jgi:thiamine biosynthesis lipoprotein
MRPAAATFAALGSTATVVVRDPRSLARARHVLEAELAEVDRACSRFRGDSELTALNCRAGEELVVGPYLLEALQTALRAAEATNGAVDPTVGEALRVAGYDRTFALVRLRDGRLVETCAAPAGAWRSIAIDPVSRGVRIPHGIKVDLGATAKALAADRAAARAAAETNTGVLVSLGGDIATAGPPPAAGWSIGLADDHAAAFPPDGTAVSIRSGGLATSSTAVRRWATANGEAHHIIDPQTGVPAVTPWRTVSVAAASCVDANTASTAAIVFGADAPAWLEDRRLPARLVRVDGFVVRTGGWPIEVAAA